MAGEVDPRLIKFLQGSMGLVDVLRDLGVAGEAKVSLGRNDGLLLLELVAGGKDTETELWSQRGRPRKDGVNSLRVGGLTFEWPITETAPAAGFLTRAFTFAPTEMAAFANDNSAAPEARRSYGFEEDAPALR